MKPYSLRTWIFLALCCDLGLFAKRMVNPFANLITGALHIPGGISTGFSLMFLATAAALTQGRFCGAAMGAVQSALALSLGMVGSMGALSPVGYIAPGLVIDLVFMATKDRPLSRGERVVLANTLASPAAALAANCIVFHLSGVVLLLYLSIAAASGAFCGVLAARLASRLAPVIKMGPGFEGSAGKGVSI